MRKGIIFDLDGTLVDCMPDFCDMMTLFLKKLEVEAVKSKPITPKIVKSVIGNGAKKSMERLLSFYKYPYEAEDTDRLFKIYMDIYNAKPLDKSKLYRGVKTTLKALQKQGYKMAICTNKPCKPTETVLSRLGIRDFFNPILHGEATPYLKPSKELMNKVVGEMNMAPADCVMVGDSEVDIKCAKTVGMPSVLVAYGFAKDDPYGMGAEAVIAKFSDLPNILKNY